MIETLPPHRRIYDPLRQLVVTRMPVLDRALGPLPLSQVRQVLNAMTGLDIKGDEGITTSSQRAHAALVEMDAAGKLPEAMQNGLWAIRKLRAQPAPANARLLTSRNKREGWYRGNGGKSPRYRNYRRVQHLRGGEAPPARIGHLLTALSALWRRARVK